MSQWHNQACRCGFLIAIAVATRMKEGTAHFKGMHNTKAGLAIFVLLVIAQAFWGYFHPCPLKTPASRPTPIKWVELKEFINASDSNGSNGFEVSSPSGMKLFAVLANHDASSSKDILKTTPCPNCSNDGPRSTAINSWECSSCWARPGYNCHSGMELMVNNCWDDQIDLMHVFWWVTLLISGMVFLLACWLGHDVAVCRTKEKSPQHTRSYHIVSS
jgi:hypothetical protein